MVDGTYASNALKKYINKIKKIKKIKNHFSHFHKFISIVRIYHNGLWSSMNDIIEILSKDDILVELIQV